VKDWTFGGELCAAAVTAPSIVSFPIVSRIDQSILAALLALSAGATASPAA
jgi:hypothetical protein